MSPNASPPDSSPPGAEGLDRAIDLEETERVPRAKSASEKTKAKRSLAEWGALLGKFLTVLVIAGGTAWNGLNTYFAEKSLRERQALIEQETNEKVEAASARRETVSDDSYRLLARTVNVHTDQLERIEAAAERIEELAGYIDWKHDQDVKRYGIGRLDRMISRYLDAGDETDHPPDLSHEELIARIVTEMASRQETRNGARVELPKKASHIPEETEFFK